MPALSRKARFRRFRLGIGAGLAVLAATAGAFAHKTNLGYGRTVIAEGTVRWDFAFSPHDVAVLLGIPTDLVAPVAPDALRAQEGRLAAYLGERLAVAADDAPCPAGPPVLDLKPLPEEVQITVVWRCPPDARTFTLAYGLFFDIDATHRLIGTVDAGRGPEEYLLDRGLNRIDIQVDAPASGFVRFGRVLLLGVEHILIGYDHILFLLALMLTSVRFLPLAAIVTAFTLAHSLTLSLAWFGLINLPSRLVEVLIAASIVAVAAENLIRREAGRRWPLAFGFGLVHGLGFYGVLSGLELARGDAVTTLLGFNLGVEAGQLAIIALAWPLLAWSARHPWYGRAVLGASGLILLAGAFWLVQRAFPA